MLDLIVSKVKCLAKNNNKRKRINFLNRNKEQYDWDNSLNGDDMMEDDANI